jgi:protein phosphatase slingshot
VSQNIVGVLWGSVCLFTRVGYILNVTREIDNFFPGTFSYHNIRVYDEETTDLLAHWNETYNFIVKAK